MFVEGSFSLCSYRSRMQPSFIQPFPKQGIWVFVFPLYFPSRTTHSITIPAIFELPSTLPLTSSSSVAFPSPRITPVTSSSSLPPLSPNYRCLSLALEFPMFAIGGFANALLCIFGPPFPCPLALRLVTCLSRDSGMSIHMCIRFLSDLSGGTYVRMPDGWILDRLHILINFGPPSPLSPWAFVLAFSCF